MFLASNGTEKLPIQPGYTFDPIRPDIREQDFENSFIRNRQQKPIAVIREYTGKTFRAGLRELGFLEAAGVSVAKHLPFVGPERRNYLLVEYIAGIVLEDDIAVKHPDTCINLARKIGRYTADAINAGRGPLTDISSSFQYMLRDAEPVLVDLDMHQYLPADNPTSRSLNAYHIYCEFSEGGGLVLPEYMPNCPNILAPLYELAYSVADPRKA